VLLFVIVVVFNWKLLLTNQYTWLDSPDLASQVLPWFQFQAGEWHTGHFPMWDPNDWGGQSLFGQMQPGAAYPLNWLLFLAPLKHGWIRQASLHWYFVMIQYLGALNCFALCRDLGRSLMASIVGACIFALGGYVGHTDWPQMLNGAVWAPLVIFYLLRVERGERPLASALLSGFFLGVSWLSGHHQIPIFLSLAGAGTWLWLCVRGGRWNWSIARLAFLSIGLAVLASGFQTIPAAEYGLHAVRWSGTAQPLHFGEAIPYSVHLGNVLRPISFFGIFIPGLGSAGDPYVGAAASGLALLGMILAWRERPVRYLAALALASLLFASGGHSLLNGILYAVVPLVEKARVPGSAVLVFAVGLAPLAAFGMDRLPLAESAAWSRRGGRILTGLAAVIGTTVFASFVFKSPVNDDRMMVTAFCAVLMAALLATWRGHTLSMPAVGLAVLGIVVMELGLEGPYWLAEKPGPAQTGFLHRLAEHSDLVEYIRSQGNPVRVEYDDEAVGYNIGEWYGLETFDNYDASLSENIYRHDLGSGQFRDFFGIKYFIGKTPRRPDEREVFRGTSGLAVFENPHALPRVWAEHKGIEGCDSTGEDVRMLRHQPNYVSIRATMSCPGMVILSDQWAPGWRATVDGKAVEIHQAYEMVRGVVVGAGEHTIEMRYRPWSVFVGAGMSLLAVFVAWASARSVGFSRRPDLG
jgi:hypothetical protein